MPKLRVAAGRLNTPAAALPKLRVAAGKMYSPPGAGTPKLRVFGATVAGPTTAVLDDMPSYTTEPSVLQTVTATAKFGSVPDSWVWTQLSGPTVALSGSGATRTFMAPANLNGTAVTLGVVAVVGGVSSAQKTVTVTMYPQLHWRATSSGWLPIRGVESL